MKKLLTLSTILLACTTAQANAFTAPNLTEIRANNMANNLHHTIAATSNELKNAEKSVKKFTDDAIEFLSDKQLTKEQKKHKFSKLLKKNFDIKSIARFSLGKNWRTATKEQKTKYIPLFEDMIINVYSNRFSDYNGQKIIIKGSRPQGKKDMFVNSLISQPSGPEIKVDWRIRNKKDKLYIIDVIVEGISMGQTQRSDFDSVIQRGGGNIDILLEHLENIK